MLKIFRRQHESCEIFVSAWVYWEPAQFDRGRLLMVSAANTEAVLVPHGVGIRDATSPATISQKAVATTTVDAGLRVMVWSASVT